MRLRLLEVVMRLLHLFAVNNNSIDCTLQRHSCTGRQRTGDLAECTEAYSNTIKPFCCSFKMHNWHLPLLILSVP